MTRHLIALRVNARVPPLPATHPHQRLHSTDHATNTMTTPLCPPNHSSSYAMIEHKFQCKRCPQAFESHSKRSAHVEHLHRAVVDISFKDGTVRSITRNVDGLFECGCGHTYDRPSTLRRHCKACSGLISLSKHILDTLPVTRKPSPSHSL